MRTSLLIAGLVGWLVAAPAAQIPTGSPQQNPTQSPTRRAAPQPDIRTAAATTLTGCLYIERDDYVLAGVTLPGASGAGAESSGVAGTSGTAPASYTVDDLPDSRLRPLVGKRVEVVGRIDTGGDPAPGAAQRDGEIKLPEFDATSIKEVTGTCPAKPVGR